MAGLSGTIVEGTCTVVGETSSSIARVGDAVLPELPCLPVPGLDGEEAGRHLRRVTWAFFERFRKFKMIAEWIDTTAEASIERERDALALLGENEAEKRRKLLRSQARLAAIKRFGKKWLKPPRMQIAVSAGTGKTSSVAELYRKSPWLWHCRVWYFAPTICLCQEFVNRINTNPPPGMPRAKVLSGRTYSEGQEPPCRRAKIVGEAQSKVQSVFKSFCNHGNGFICDFYGNCKYISDRKDNAPGIRAFSHASMVVTQSCDLTPERPDLVIVDETCLATFVRHMKVHPESIGAVGTYVRESDTDQEAALAEEYALLGAHIADLMISAPAYLSQLGTLGVTSDLLRAMAKAADRPITCPAIFPNDRDDQVRRKLEWHVSNPGHPVATLYRQLASDLDAGLTTSIAIEVITEPTDVRDGQNGGKFSPHIVVHGLKKPAFSKDVSLLLIDADADLEINNRLFPGRKGSRLRAVSITAIRLGSFVQCSNAAFPKSYFTSYRLLDGVDRGQQSLARIRAFAQGLAEAGKRVLIVLNKPVRVMLTGEPLGALPLYFQLAVGIEVTHFGRFIGQDRWRNFDAVIVVGREEPPALQVEQIARALYGKNCDLQFDFRGEYVRAVRKYAMDRPEFAEISIHPDPRVQNILELLRERQSCQAIDRVRLIHRDERQVEVYILCNIPLPGIASPKLVSAKDLLSGGPRIERAFARGVFTTNAKLLAGLYGDLWRTPKAAEHDLSRWTAKTPETHRKCLYAEWGLLKYAEVRIDRAKKWSPVWHDPMRVPDLMAFIERSLSPKPPTTIELRHPGAAVEMASAPNLQCAPDPAPVFIQVSFTLPRVVACGTGVVHGLAA
jgi:hypothetical protein